MTAAEKKRDRAQYGREYREVTQPESIVFDFSLGTS